MESVDARIYELEPSYAAQEPPPCRLSKEDLSKTPFKNPFPKPSRFELKLLIEIRFIKFRLESINLG
jgi:hypothetical protein